MRILSLVTDGFGAGGGIARYNSDLMTALAQSMSVAEVVVLPRFGLTAAETPTKVRQLPASANKGVWSARALSCAAKQRFDIVFCGHFFALPVARFAAELSQAKLWVQVHGYEAWQPRSKFHRSALNRTKLVTSVSRFTRHKLLSWTKLPPQRIRVLPNTVSSHFYSREKCYDLVNKHFLDGKRIILTVGRLSSGERYKGHDRIINALPAVLTQVPDASYLIVGSGDDEERLKQLAAEKGVADRVVFAGQVPAGQLPDYFALADVFAMPSTGEGFGIVFLEAAACGLPVIGGRSDGSVDALAEGRIGRLVNPDSPEDIATALGDALLGRLDTNPAEFQRFSFQNFERHVNELIKDLSR